MESLYIIKIGGNIVDNPNLLTTCLQAFSKLKGSAILVHGGGKLATEMATSLGIEQKLVDGRRVTDEATLKMVTMVYAGHINKTIVAQLQGMGVNALGLSGVDANLMTAHKRITSTVDFGFVGDIDFVNSAFVQEQLIQNRRLVIAPITHDGKGQLLNTNADTIAQSIATAMASLYDVHLIYGFEKEGVLENIQDEGSVISFINPPIYAQLKQDKIIFEGMLPKLENAFQALNSGVKSVLIGKAEKMNELINGTAGTTIKN